MNNNTYELRVQAVKDWKPPEWEYQKVREEGADFVTTRYMQKPVKTHIKRVDKEHYKVIKTGEIKEYQPMDEKKQALSRRSSLSRRFDELKAIIRTNFASEGSKESDKQLFITLTYAENMTDESRLYTDFRDFMKRLIYSLNGVETLYVAVTEPQGRGAWHVHLMLKALNRKWFWIDKEKISEIWGHGYTTTTRLKSNDVGAYYTAYFTGLIAETANDETNIDDNDDETGESVLIREQELARLYDNMCGEKMSKAHIKGKRLHMYPKGMKFYRCSRNVGRPKVYTDFVHVMESSEEFQKVNEKAYIVEKVHTADSKEAAMGEIERLNTIHKATYRRKQRDALKDMAKEISGSLESPLSSNGIMKNTVDLIKAVNDVIEASQPGGLPKTPVNTIYEQTRIGKE